MRETNWRRRSRQVLVLPTCCKDIEAESRVHNISWLWMLGRSTQLVVRPCSRRDYCSMRCSLSFVIVLDAIITLSFIPGYSKGHHYGVMVCKDSMDLIDGTAILQSLLCLSHDILIYKMQFVCDCGFWSGTLPSLKGPAYIRAHSSSLHCGLTIQVQDRGMLNHYRITIKKSYSVVLKRYKGKEMLQSTEAWEEKFGLKTTWTRHLTCD